MHAFFQDVFCSAFTVPGGDRILTDALSQKCKASCLSHCEGIRPEVARELPSARMFLSLHPGIVAECWFWMRYEERHLMSFGFLIDMDGVIYRGTELIPGARQFIVKLLDENVPFLFLTNNSQRSRRDVATKLNRMGMPIEEKHVFTCAMATARFLARQLPNGTAFVIGESGLMNALHSNGYSIVDSHADYVVVGEGRTLSFEMVERAVQLILEGAKLIATNLDPNCPTSTGTRPGCGAVVALLEKATGVKAFSVGKPSPVMMRAARKELGLDAANTIMIGDTMDTDILGGVQMGYRTVLVLSGTTSRQDLQGFAFRPDLVVESIADLLQPNDEIREQMEKWMPSEACLAIN